MRRARRSAFASSPPISPNIRSIPKPSPSPGPRRRIQIYSDGKRLRAPFPAVSQGAVIEEEFIERETEPLFAAGHSGWTTFGRERVPVEHSHLEFDAPASLPLRTGTMLLET